MAWEIAVILGFLGVVTLLIHIAFTLKEDLFVLKWLFFFFGLLGTYFTLIITSAIARPNDANISNMIDSVLGPYSILLLVTILLFIVLTTIQYLKQLKATKKDKERMDFGLDHGEG